MDPSKVVSGSSVNGVSGSTSNISTYNSNNTSSSSTAFPPSRTHTNPNIPGMNLGLPQFPHRNNSVSSLMDAVMGPKTTSNQQQSPQQTSPAHYLPTPTALKSSYNPITGNRPNVSSGLSNGNTSSGLGDWDILSDVTTSKVNEGQPQPEEAVKELQEKVDKRRSQLPHLESELAALEAQIRATEERLSRASGGAVSTGSFSGK
ncbi:uncharacterized protein L201_006746 [Kwoniella dendrophila CBS 6074]|uniref:Uncharacterized protein n=1 Tax=Kwoniella dendrophila CBS 6074 TaxID=1295534 RepID=A0AAX4K349_9TREE